MQLDTWLVFALAYLLITLSPGPNVLLVCAHALRFGYRSVLTTIAANLLCQLAIVIAVSLGIGALVTTGSTAFQVIKFCGAAYLIYLGIKTIYGNIAAVTPLASTASLPSMPDLTHRQRFIQAFLVSAGNPKTVIFLAAFLPQFIDPNASVTLQFTQMYLTIAITVSGVHAAIAAIALYLKRRVTNHRLRQSTSLATGGLFVFLGIQLSRS
ncbi:LysE family translocator [Cognatishimia sp. WU-CL00825]|uniref:LysE family translocator n=1 Tax=Cognatishimia sp. WU-CL00825 TaxID=3127658 RepID=UPI0033654538